jgi:hypothetical protein
MIFNLLALIPVVLFFLAAYAAARPSPGRVVAASWYLSVMAAVLGAAMPLTGLVRWGIGASMSAGTHSGISMVYLIGTLAAGPYYLWFAATIAPITSFRQMRRWDAGMHFIYAPAYLLIYSYLMGTAMAFTLITQGIALAGLIVFWYRLVDLQALQPQLVRT